MSLSVVRLGSSRGANEGVRIGTVRKPPRGVPKTAFAERNYYDVWLPELSPSIALMALGKGAESASEWEKFVRKYRSEMNRPEPSRLLLLLATLSHQSNFSVGCYCEDEAHCHRSVLRELLKERGAALK